MSPTDSKSDRITALWPEVRAFPVMQKAIIEIDDYDCMLVTQVVEIKISD